MNDRMEQALQALPNLHLSHGLSLNESQWMDIIIENRGLKANEWINLLTLMKVS